MSWQARSWATIRVRPLTLTPSPSKSRRCWRRNGRCTLCRRNSSSRRWRRRAAAHRNHRRHHAARPWQPHRPSARRRRAGRALSGLCGRGLGQGRGAYLRGARGRTRRASHAHAGLGHGYRRGGDLRCGKSLANFLAAAVSGCCFTHRLRSLCQRGARRLRRRPSLRPHRRGQLLSLRLPTSRRFGGRAICAPRRGACCSCLAFNRTTPSVWPSTFARSGSSPTRPILG